MQIHTKSIDLSKIESLISQLKPKTKERFLIRVGERYHSIQITNINCFYIVERYSFIHAEDGKNYAIDYSLEKVEQMVNAAMFFRVNRSFIINFSSIKDIVAYSSSRLKIVLKNWQDDTDIIVSRERVSEFKNWMDR